MGAEEDGDGDDGFGDFDPFNDDYDDLLEAKRAHKSAAGPKAGSSGGAFLVDAVFDKFMSW